MKEYNIQKRVDQVKSGFHCVVSDLKGSISVNVSDIAIKTITKKKNQKLVEEMLTTEI
jgi:hypothetical protein